MTEEAFAQKYMERLNEQQKQAVRTGEGAVLLLAVPGSGKTTVLVTRLGYLVLCRGVQPENILTVTYTVAATEEMRARFAGMFGRELSERMEFRTINGISARIIQYYSQLCGRPAFRLLDSEGDRARILRDIYREEVQEFATESIVKDLQTRITYIKNRMLTREEIDALGEEQPHLPEIYRAYCEELRRRGCMDYDDQMTYALNILRKFPEVLERVQQQYRYLCVDESQDTSLLQHVIIRLLAKASGNLFMVGDEDQSIYGFRAADPGALLHFSEDHPGAQVLLLEQNYRSGGRIVDAANAFVERNRFRHPKVIRASREEGSPVRVADADGRRAQYLYLYALAQRCDRQTAVLYRNHESALPLIDLLERGGVPYSCRKFNGAFFTHRIVCDLTDMIALALDPRNTEAFLRVYYKFGLPISKKAAEYACRRSGQSGQPVLQALLTQPELRERSFDAIQGLAAMLIEVKNASAAEALRILWRGGYGQYVQGTGLDAGKFDILLLLAEREDTPQALLERLARLQDCTRSHENTDAPLILSTVHGAKGLEYDRVYLLDVLDGVLPALSEQDAQSEEERQQYEEERRLFYVGMTRAKDELYLFRCRGLPSAFCEEVISRLPRPAADADSVLSVLNRGFCGMHYDHREKGRGKVIAQDDERLLIEYRDGTVQLLTFPELIEQRSRKVKYTSGAPAEPSARQTEEDRPEGAVPGRLVRHKKFGVGVITRCEGIYVTIRFSGDAGEKKFNWLIAVKNRIILPE